MARSLGPQALEQIAQLCEAKVPTFLEQPLPRRVELRALGGRAQDRLEHPEQEGLHGHHLDPLAGGPGGARGEVGE